MSRRHRGQHSDTDTSPTEEVLPTCSIPFDLSVHILTTEPITLVYVMTASAARAQGGRDGIEIPAMPDFALRLDLTILFQLSCLNVRIFLLSIMEWSTTFRASNYLRVNWDIIVKLTVSLCRLLLACFLLRATIACSRSLSDA